jgi:chemotaxis response regulator CheB
MPKRDIIVIGSLAGAAGALHRLVADQSPELQASIFIVTHVPPTTSAELHEARASDYAEQADVLRRSRAGGREGADGRRRRRRVWSAGGGA